MLKEMLLMFFCLILCSSGLNNQKPDFNLFIHFHDAQDAKDNVSKDKNGLDYSNRIIAARKGNQTISMLLYLYISSTIGQGDLHAPLTQLEGIWKNILFGIKVFLRPLIGCGCLDQPSSLNYFFEIFFFLFYVFFLVMSIYKGPYKICSLKDQ